MKKEDIVELRESLGVTQEKFASLLGTTVVTVNRWENGRASPSRMSIKALKELRSQNGSYLRRREELEKSR